MEVLFKISNNQLVLRYFNKKTVRNSLIIMFRGRCSVSTLEGHVHITSEGGPAGGGGEHTPHHSQNSCANSQLKERSR